MKPERFLVTAAPGRSVPLHPSEASAPGGALLIVNPGDEVDVPNSVGVRRRIRAGDLIVVAANKSGSASTAKPKRSTEE